MNIQALLNIKQLIPIATLYETHIIEVLAIKVFLIINNHQRLTTLTRLSRLRFKSIG